jgi:putative endonuclease
MYVLICNDNSFYCGITTNLERRLKQHNGVIKGGAKYTRSKRPCRFVYIKKALDHSNALKIEYKFKQLNRKNKIKYINQARQLEEQDQFLDLQNLIDYHQLLLLQ